MKRTFFLSAALLVVVSMGSTLPAQQAARNTRPAQFNVFEASIADMQAAMKAGRTSSHEIVQQYLTRIATYEDQLHAAITVNPKALEEADARDRERAQGRVRGPLHGVPIALKDNIWTAGPETFASNAGRLLLDHRFGCLPVLDAIGRLIGIVTERDYLRFAVKAIEMHD